MKSNIDLTEGRDFPERFSTPNDLITRALLRHVGIPWKLKYVASDLDLHVESDRLFPTGTKAQIKSRLLTDRACSGNYCDRCGANLKDVPWRNLFGLCRKCNAQLALEFGRSSRNRIPWRG